MLKGGSAIPRVRSHHLQGRHQISSSQRDRPGAQKDTIQSACKMPVTLSDPRQRCMTITIKASSIARRAKPSALKAQKERIHQGSATVQDWQRAGAYFRMPTRDYCTRGVASAIKGAGAVDHRLDRHSLCCPYRQPSCRRLARPKGIQSGCPTVAWSMVIKFLPHIFPRTVGTAHPPQISPLRAPDREVRAELRQ